MLIFTKITELQGFLAPLRAAGKNIGFVPTMGALHQGHLSLIAASRQSCDLTVSSVFVNPTQFNDKADLLRYPRMPEKDADMLRSAGCEVLFMPAVEEMYPQQETASFDFGQLGSVLEGRFRPGHFNGVAQVIKRFFEIIAPQQAFFGRKDLQQVLIVKALVKQCGFNTTIVPCPIVREPDGLAMSSRNALLSEEERKVAAAIPLMMQEAAAIAVTAGIKAARRHIGQRTAEHPLMRLDYFEICDPDTLEALSDDLNKRTMVALIALYVGKIRLIDNLDIN